MGVGDFFGDAEMMRSSAAAAQGKGGKAAAADGEGERTGEGRRLTKVVASSRSTLASLSRSDCEHL
eukprot:COSAG01_NODE_582_length_15201_cov_7.218315_14_plen_66_part_00